MTRVLVQGPDGSVKVTEAAIAQVVRGAVASVAGARLKKGRRRLAVKLEGGHGRADLELGIGYGLALPDVAAAVQERVSQSLASTFDVTVDAVDVTVVELDR